MPSLYRRRGTEPLTRPTAVLDPRHPAREPSLYRRRGTQPPTRPIAVLDPRHPARAPLLGVEDQSKEMCGGPSLSSGEERWMGDFLPSERFFDTPRHRHVPLWCSILSTLLAHLDEDGGGARDGPLPPL